MYIIIFHNIKEFHIYSYFDQIQLKHLRKAFELPDSESSGEAIYYEWKESK